MAEVYVGNVVKCRAEFFDEDDAPIDPEHVFFQYRLPNGVEATLEYGEDAEVVREAEGVYYVLLSLDVAGTTYCCWRSTGVGQAAKEIIIGAKPLSFDAPES